MSIPAYPVYPVEAVRPKVLAEMLTKFGNTPRRGILLAAAIDAAVSLCTSAIARVRREDGTASPIFDYGLLVSPTGAGKTHQDRRVKPSIKDFIDERSAVAADEMIHQESLDISHKSKIKHLGNKIGKDFVEGADVTNEEIRLRQLIAKTPKSQTMPDWLYEETTLQALLRGLHNFPVAALWVDDAAYVLDALIRQALSIIAKLWDEGTLAHNRVVNGRMNIHSSFTMYLTIQNEIYADFLAKSGKKFVASGVAGRFLPYVVTADMMGDDNIDDSADDNGVGEGFAKCAQELLGHEVINAKTGLAKLPVLELSEPAKIKRSGFRRQVQEMLRNPELADCTGFVAKMPDHVLRLAARWHLFERVNGDLSAEYLESAIEVVLTYHLPVYRLLHTKPQHARNEVRDAQLLLDILCDSRRYERLLPRAELRNLAYNVGISTNNRFENALGLLGSEGKIHVSPKGRIHLVLPNQTSGIDRSTIGQIAQQPNMSPDRFNR
jgi:hypothetical protein